MLYPLSFIRKKLVIDGIVCSQCLKVLGCEAISIKMILLYFCYST